MITKFEEYLLLLEKFEENQIKKIQTFCNVPEIYNWAIEFSPKLSVWLSNVVKNLLIKQYKGYDDFFINFLKVKQMIIHITLKTP